MFVNEINKSNSKNISFIENGQLINTDFISKLIELSNNQIDYLNGTIIFNSKLILVTEGPYDKKYIEKAIEIFSVRDDKYKKLSQITIIPSNSASNADTFLQQILLPQINKYNKIIFLFDFDEEGYNGWKKIKKFSIPQLDTLFYQLDYSIKLNTSNSPNVNETIMVEDLFNSKAYESIVNNANLNNKRSHKDFRLFKNNLASSIKTHIEKNYSSFNHDWYDGFEPLLDKLLNIYNL